MNRKRGFSLIEMSIMLGLFGIVTAGLWTVIGSTNQKLKITRTQEHIRTIVTNVRDYYAGRALPTAAKSGLAPDYFTDTMRRAGVFPEDLCSTSCVADAGVSVPVYNVYGSGSSSYENYISIPSTTGFNEVYVQFRMFGMSTAKFRPLCYQIASYFSSQAPTIGLTYFRAGGGMGAGPAIASFPTTMSAIEGTCNVTGGGGTILTFGFKIRL